MLYEELTTMVYQEHAGSGGLNTSLNESQPREEDGMGSLLQNSGFLFGLSGGYYERLCITYKMVVLGVLMLLMGLFGYVGNALTIVTMWPTRLTTGTSLILIVLAVCDSGVCFVWWLNLGVPAICDYIRSTACNWYFAFVYRCTHLYVWPIGRWCHYAGTWIVLLVTAHRFIAVCHPLKANKWSTVAMARAQLKIICLAAFIYVLPRVFYGYLVLQPDGGGVRLVKNAFGANVFWFSTFYESILYLILIYVIPFPLLAFMTVRLVVSLRKTREKRNQMTKSKREEKDLTTTLVMVVLVFMICQLPNPIRRLLVSLLTNEQRGCDTFYPYYRSLASFLLVFNSSINFVIYFIFSERFRKILVKKLYKYLGLQARVGINDTTVEEQTHTQQQNDTTKHAD